MVKGSPQTGEDVPLTPQGADLSKSTLNKTDGLFGAIRQAKHWEEGEEVMSGIELLRLGDSRNKEEGQGDCLLGVMSKAQEVVRGSISGGMSGQGKREPRVIDAKGMQPLGCSPAFDTDLTTVLISVLPSVTPAHKCRERDHWSIPLLPAPGLSGGKREELLRDP